MRPSPPSPAMLVALLALFVALGGSAVALKGKNRVDSGDIKNGQVSSKDLKDGSATGADVADGTIGGADIGDGSIGGAEIEDGSLSGADLANDSVNGADVDEASLDLPAEVTPISARVTAGTTIDLFSLNGLTISFVCQAGGGVSINRTQVNGFLAAESRSFGNLPLVQNEGSASNENLLTVPVNGRIDEEYTFRRSSDGATVTSDFTVVTTDAQVGTDCLVMGDAFASAP
jgi:hypothetical protein